MNARREEHAGGKYRNDRAGSCSTFNLWWTYGDRHRNYAFTHAPIVWLVLGQVSRRGLSTLLSRIVKIKSLGLFHDVYSEKFNFTKITLIYAENGRGKSTLSSLFRSVRTGDVRELHERRTIGSPDDPHAHLRFDTGVNVVLSKGTWSSVRDEVVVFDADFVDKNVYSGISVTTSHRKSLLDFALGTSAVAQRGKSDNADAAFDAAKLVHDALVTKLSEHHVGQTFIEFQALSEPQNFDNLVADLSQRRANASEAGLIERTPDPVPLQPMTLDLDTVLRALTSTIDDAHNDAENLVQNHIASMHRSASDVAEPSAWLAKGGDYDDGKACPYCDQPTGGVELVRAYRTVFNDTFSSLRTAVEDAYSHVSAQLTSDAVERVSTKVDLANSLLENWQKRCSITLLELDKAIFLDQIVAIRRVIELQLEAKKSDISSYKISDKDRKDLTTKWAAISAPFDAMNAIQSTNAEAVTTLKASLALESVEEIDKQQRDLERAHLRHSPQMVKQILEIGTAKTDRDARKREKDKARSELSEVMDRTLEKYGESTNIYLTSLGAPFLIHTITGNHRAGGRSDFAINMRGSQVRAEGGIPTFSTALSDGDKRTLALAFFFASTLEHSNVAELTVVIDDPVSSFDSARTQATVALLKKLGSKANQVIVLSHDAYFLRQLKGALDSGEPVAMLGIGTVPEQYSTIEQVDIEKICESKYYRHYRIVREMADGSFGDAPTAVQSIRPLLEGYLVRRYPHLLSPRGSLSDYIQAIEAAVETSPLAALKGFVTDLKDVGTYANPNHHDEGPAGDDGPVSSAEVREYCNRALKIVYA